MSDEPFESFFARLAERSGTAVLAPGEADAVLDLARVVAHGVERRFAPLAAYATGLTLGAHADPAEREKAVRAVIAVVRELSS